MDNSGLPRLAEPDDALYASTLGAADIIVIKQSDQVCGYDGPVVGCYDTSISVP